MNLPSRPFRRRAAGAVLGLGLERQALSYGPEPRHRLLAWRPRGLPPATGWPALLLFHGGGYVTGKPEDFISLAPRFAHRGIWTAAVGYGLAPAHPFPVALEDAQLALSFLDDQPVDRERVGLLGFSAGGHLALLLGSQLPVAAVCAASAPTDLLDHPIPGFPATDLARTHSPAHRSLPPAPRVLLVHGTADDVVPFVHARVLAAAFPGVEIHAIEGGNHDITRPHTAAWAAKIHMERWMSSVLLG